MLQRCPLDRIRHQKVEEKTGCFFLGVATPGRIKDAIGIIVPQVHPRIDDSQIAPAALSALEIIDSDTFIDKQGIIGKKDLARSCPASYFQISITSKPAVLPVAA
jgi:hypothetical protein